MALGSAVDEVHTAVGVDDAAELANFESESSVLERFLHLSALEEAQVAAGPCRGAVTVRVSGIHQRVSELWPRNCSGDVLVCPSGFDCCTYELTLASEANLSLLESC